MNEYEKDSNNKNINNPIDSTSELPTSNYSAYNVSNGTNYNSKDNKYSDNNFTDSDYKVTSVNKQPKRGKRIVSYIALAIICTILGGTASGVVSLYILPKTDFFKSSPLYENLMQQSSSNTNNNSNYKPSSIVSTTNGLTIAEIAKKVSPAVVGVSTTSTTTNNFLGQSQESEGMGSGIIFNNDGYILTNYHVISGAQKISVILSNKKEVSAKVVNYDASMDIAVIKINEKVTLPGIAELGNSSNLQVGDQVVAIGNPLGKEFLGSVTSGIVSALNREVEIEDNNTQTLIQTDAAINPGNSGGPLVNSQGQVIGINSSKIGGNGVEGIGFAIPIDLVKPKISSLSKPILMLGITCTDVSSEDAKQNNVPQGVAVIQVNSSSPAQKAGLQARDIITKFDGKTVKTTDELNSIKATHNAGDKIKIEIYRNGETKSLTLTLSE
ncbi:serine protease Do-like HtrB [Clostridium pasteurianum DSM 525 = ATCC 6013]|uniref:HtrA2 peptidase n=1 Tax=Clostridium pasteurianum DSM 525 = ATCC 6013 TaxID=1262449 RepID=A0A0H3J4A1_CLOPA|nr:trypsin-like peptidase domain-containing protein [Clostridium pasteurianum]AJA47702.1 serine protease Do-like HtrB [Clostridium pasteurianum DSM 525 = ATCC 6013]AJA51690.1 serine protease Do-like HtrB [Clostridium pasteurianum DSM 525 = ATCC 6013]ELP59605.1 HtrA-like serine protease (with PDZ domain) [Clostridium pasteurianum DSM 525 = ATCC 6013]KRU12303.1 HtrA2 peptidase [Clostridium pasteurianum DSM 525 = ATCC 6013]UZW15865.1 trypsin-like peptidase domain-containing protein [Clostridium p